MKIPQIIGHRGACGYAPENTVESIDTAASLGTQWVALDVKLTRDSVPIIFHDDTLDRTTNGHGNVADTLFSEIDALDAGAWYADAFAGAEIPTLEQAVDVILKHKMGLYLEIKPCPGREQETAEATLDVLSRIWDDMDTIILSSYQHVSLETCLDMAPDYKRALMLSEPDKNWQQVCDYLDVTAINIDGNNPLFTREVVEDFLETERMVGGFVINDPFRAKTLLSWGMDYVFSDTPDVIEQALNTKH